VILNRAMRPRANARVVTLGGLGADSHSVGLTLLRHALSANGYEVEYLGIQNRLRTFFEYAHLSDVVMMSCMDGHARYYLKSFPELRMQFSAGASLWYIGGNLSVHDVSTLKSDLIPLGFARVFPAYVDIPTVLSLLARDLAAAPPRPPCSLPVSDVRPTARLLPPPDECMDLGRFTRQRQEVLEQWPTGSRARRLSENARFLSRQPSFALAQSLPTTKTTPLLQPRSGVALVENQIADFLALREAGADVLSYQVDSLTRSNAYPAAATAIAESRERRTSTLNGFPMVNHGVDELRRVISTIRMPLQARHSTRDPRLLAEISFAGGVTGFEGGAICYNVPYYKDYPIAESLDRWQYVDRLAGIYFERYGIVIDREFFGTLTAVLIPPSLAIVTNLIEVMLAVMQGVRSVSLGYAEQGNRSQDIAAVRVMRDMTATMLAEAGHYGVRVNTVFHQYMAAFPQDPERARALIVASATTAKLSAATRVLVKTPVEATRIPSVDDNREGLALSRQGIADAVALTLDEATIAQEESMLRKEVGQLIESVIACGSGSLTQGVPTAFARGLIDIPFAPSAENRGEVLTARDANGAVRFLNIGRLQLSAEVQEFHRSMIDGRRQAMGPEPRDDWALVEHDTSQVPLGHYQRWPLDE
jgi:methylaspartate mutase epsilon subunit